MAKKTTDETVPMKLRPIGDRLVVRQHDAIEKTAGGIIIPDSVKEKPMEGEVLAVGTGRVTDSGETVPLAVKVGEHVLFNKYAGTQILVGGEEYIIIKEADVVGVMDR